jgi:hypothetical protein
MRWPVEMALEEAKGEVGLDHFETRTWQGWHHHMLQSFLAHLFLIRLRLLFQKKSPALTTAQARQLVARAIQDEAKCLPDLSAIVHYHQCRNHAAYCSHTKRTRSQLHRRTMKRRKRKVS